MNGIILLLSGPNLDLLGSREPEIYGKETLEDHVINARNTANEYNFELEHFQSASQADLVAAIHSARRRCAAIVINPGAFTHYAWALHDALAAYDGIVIEVHLSNPNKRESWRHISVVSSVATGSIVGLGSLGYLLAVQAAANCVAKASS